MRYIAAIAGNSWRKGIAVPNNRVVQVDTWLPSTVGCVMDVVDCRQVVLNKYANNNDPISINGTYVDCIPMCEKIVFFIDNKHVEVSIECEDSPIRWTGEKALAGFDYNGQNDPRGTRGKDYDSANDTIKGSNRGDLRVDPIYANPQENRLKSNREKILSNQGKIITKYTVTFNFKITYVPNKLYYPRKRDNAEELHSKIIYLHELGHLLEDRKIVPQKGLRATAVLTNVFDGDPKTTNNVANTWTHEISISLKDKLLCDIARKMDKAAKLYHCKYWSAGNPWEDKPRGEKVVE
jgi:hypothetical protein